MAKTNTARNGGGARTAPNGPTGRGNTTPGTGAGTRTDGAAAAVQGALTADPGGTVTAIAAAAGMSKNAARKALLALEAEGLAVRTTGGRDGGKRAPDTWRPAEADTRADTVPDTVPADAAPEPNPEPEQQPDETATTGDEAAQADDATEADAEEGMDGAAVTEASEALTALRDAVGAALAAMESGNRAALLEVAETIYTGSGRARRLVRAAANGRPRTSSGRARSHPGELRGKVAAHLAAHPGAEFTPHEIGKVIGHSAGAIANALDRLIAQGEAMATCERPRRFTAATDTPITDPAALAEDVPAGDQGAAAEASTEPETA